MPKIFISYRREDSQYQADRLHAVLKEHVDDPKRDIFIDVHNIPVGVDFVEHLDRQVAQCDVLLAVIGPDWLDARKSVTGERRLDDPKDFVRIEIASALKRGIPVAPVLLDGTPFPGEESLPDDLKPLARRNGVEVRRLTFDADAERMIKGLGIARKSTWIVRAIPVEKPRDVAGPLLTFAIITTLAGAVWFTDPFGWKTDQASESALIAKIAEETLDASLMPESGRPAETAWTPEQAQAVSRARKKIAFEAAVKLRPVDERTFRDRLSDGSDGPEMVVVPAGTFSMGSPTTEVGHEVDESPQRNVSITKAFAVGRFEVTQAEWNQCVEGGGGCKAAVQPIRPVEDKTTSTDHGRMPITDVSWQDAQLYAAWLSKKSGATYRLLTEAEWEYAARADSAPQPPQGFFLDHSRFYTGDAIASDQANFGNYGDGVATVGSYPPNQFGVYDTLGNVWEWVEDCYETTYSNKPWVLYGGAYTDGLCATRVIRGGSHAAVEVALRSANRDRDNPDKRMPNVGFRIAQPMQ